VFRTPDRHVRAASRLSLNPGEKVLMVEDVVTTGLSSREAICRGSRRRVVAEAALVDRSAGAVDLGVPFYPLVSLNFPTDAPTSCRPRWPQPAIKPGSRAQP
jgi:orotate phosphoribosyltransferase